MDHKAFVASTYEDLQDHRKRVIESLLQAGIHVDPMENWTAATDEPKELSQDRMRGCHLCILLVAFRRGHVPSGEALSITQLEYQAAVNAGINVLVFMLDDDSPWQRKFDEMKEDPEIGQWRADLKETKVVSFFGLDPSSVEIAPALTRWIQEADVKVSGTGIRVVQDLIAKVSAVADAVSRSKEIIENTHRQLNKLQAFKAMHDELHTVEMECLRPLQESADSKTRIRPFRTTFEGAMRRVRDSVLRQDMSASLSEDILDELKFAHSAIQRAEADPSDQSFAEMVGALDVLVSSLPPRLNDCIADAAVDLDLDRLLRLLETVRQALPPNGGGGGLELEPLLEGIDALARLRDDLARQSLEHTRLQSLDLKLRTIHLGERSSSKLEQEWVRVKRARSRLEPPFSPPLESGIDNLAAIENDIEASLARGDDQNTLDLIAEYSRAVSSVFRDVDTALKEFCLQLSQVSHPLEAILKVC